MRRLVSTVMVSMEAPYQGLIHGVSGVVLAQAWCTSCGACAQGAGRGAGAA